MAVTLGVVAATLVIGVTAFNFALRSSLSAEADRVALDRAEAALSRVEAGGGSVMVVRGRSTPGRLNSGAWVLDRGRLVDGPEADPDLERRVVSLWDAPRGFMTTDDPSTRLLVVPITTGEVRVGSVVAGVRLAPYERTARLALAGSVALAAATLIVLGLLAWWTLGAALRPVGRMTALAEQWSDRDPDRRFELGTPHDEITRLGQTLDQLLDRVAASVRRERRLSAEIAHELRTPISRISAEAELALSTVPRLDDREREAFEAIRYETRRIARTIETLVATAGATPDGPRGTSMLDEVVGDVVEAADAASSESRITVDTSGVEPLRIGVEADTAGEILRPLVENAFAYGATTVTITSTEIDSVVDISVADDGPGVDVAERMRIFEPGRRGRVGSEGGHRGAGLGLALARRLARGVGGEVTAEASPEGGRFHLRLPLG